MGKSLNQKWVKVIIKIIIPPESALASPVCGQVAGLALDRGSSRDRDPMWMDPGKILGARTWIPAVFDQSGSLVGVSRRIPAK